MTSAQNLRELPNSRNHNCFGCSPVNPSGLQMRFFTDGRAVYSRVKVPEHLCGWSNIVHGGVLTTILDEVMSWSAITLLKRIALTRGIAVEFIKPVQVGGELKAEGRVRETGGRTTPSPRGSSTTRAASLVPAQAPPSRCSPRRSPGASPSRMRPPSRGSSASSISPENQMKRNAEIGLFTKSSFLG